jgi:hypothetical protein
MGGPFVVGQQVPRYMCVFVHVSECGSSMKICDVAT